MSPHKFDLVIFDCDGVLVDSETLAVRVDQRVLADLGVTLTHDEIVERFVGGTAEHFRRETEKLLGRPLPEDWERPYRSWYIDAFESDLRPVDGVAAVLATLPHRMCVATNGTCEGTTRKLRQTGLLQHFADDVFSADDVLRAKPAPDLFLLAAERCGVLPERCAVVEDSRIGVTAARAAGMTVFGYAGGLTAAQALHGPRTTVFTAMSQLPELLGVR